MTILYQTDFDSLTGLTLTDAITPNPSVSATQAYGGSGNSLKCVIPAFVGGAPQGYRAEINKFPHTNGTEYITPGVVYKFGYAIYLPSTNVYPTLGVIITQWHNHPFGGLAYTNPSRQINIRPDGFYWDKVKLHDLISNSWVRIVLEFRSAADSSGYIKVYINDLLVRDETGSNMASPAFADGYGYKPYIKMGLYAWTRKEPVQPTWNGSSTGEMIAYIDKLKIGDPAATYADVDPAVGIGAPATEVTYLSLGDTAPLNSRFVSGSSSFAEANFDASGIASVPGYSVGGQFGTALSLNINSGATSEIWASLTNDTTLDTEKVLEVGIASPHASEGNQRVQFGVSMDSAKVLKIRCKLWLHPDVGLLKTYPGIYDWFAISSVFSDNTWASAYPFVMSVDIAKQSSAVPSDLKWRLRGRTYTYPGYSPNPDLWEYFSTTAVPIGKWMLVEHEITDGNSSTGRYKIFITPEGGTRTQVLDVTNWTRHPSKPAGTGPTAFTPVKWYTGTAQINHVKNLGGKLIAQFDNVQAFAAATDIAWPTSEGTTITLKTGGGDPGTNEVRINAVNVNDTIEPSTQVNVATGNLLSGVYSATISDSDTTVNNLEAIGLRAGSEAAFNTNALTGISTPATVTLLYDLPHYYDDNPRKPWANNGSSYNDESNYETVIGPYVNGVTLSSNGDNAGKITEPILTATSGDVVEVVFYYAAGTSPNIIAFVGRTGSLDRLQATGAQGSPTITSDTLSTGDAAVTTGVSTIYPSLKWIKLIFTIKAGFTDQVFLGGLGPYSTTVGHTINILATLAWKNKVARSIQRTVTIPSLLPNPNAAPVISTVGALTSGTSVAVTGTGLRAVVAAKISDGVTDAIIRDWVPNADGTGATFTAPFGMAASGNSLVVTWAAVQSRSSDPVNWTAGNGVTITPYDGSTWASANAAYIASGGLAYGRAGVDVISTSVGDTVKTVFRYISGNSGRVAASVRHTVTGLQFIVSGHPGSLEITRSDLGTVLSHSYEEREINGVREIEVVFLSDQAGQLTVNMGPDSDIDGADVVACEATQWSVASEGGVSFAVTVTSSTVKKFVWSTAGGNAIHCYNAATNTMTPFTGNMAITITDGDYFTPGDNEKEIAYAPVVVFVAGEGELLESDLTFGSINALLTGSQGYNYWATNGTCRADNAIELIAE